MFNKKNKNYIPPQNTSFSQSTESIAPADSAMGDFTKSYVPEDEGSGYMLGYLSIVFGLLFNVIGMTLGIISIVRGIKKKKLILSLLGVVGIFAGVLSIWLYMQAFQLILPGVTYDREASEWVIRQEDADEIAVDLSEYFVRSPGGQSYTISLPSDLEVRKTDDDSEHDYFVTEDSQVQTVGDFKATILFFAEYDEPLTSGDIRDLTNEVIRQDQSAIESASFGILRDTHRGIVPDTIEIIESTDRLDIDHAYFEEVLTFEVAFRRLIDDQIVPTSAHVGLLYHRERIVLLSVSSSQLSVMSSAGLPQEVIESFRPR